MADVVDLYHPGIKQTYRAQLSQVYELSQSGWQVVTEENPVAETSADKEKAEAAKVAKVTASARRHVKKEG